MQCVAAHNALLKVVYHRAELEGVPDDMMTLCILLGS